MTGVSHGKKLKLSSLMLPLVLEHGGCIRSKAPPSDWIRKHLSRARLYFD